MTDTSKHVKAPIATLSVIIIVISLWLPGLCCVCQAEVISRQSEILFSGEVLDNEGEPVIGAIVKFLTADDKMATYCITDKNGRFKVQVSNSDVKPVKVSVSAMGYETLKLPIGKNTDFGKLTMAISPLMLDEITAKAPRAFQKGDTIVYNVDSLKTKSDVSIEDVIKKIPGISVSPEGAIKYQNKPINKFYIEGMDLLGGRYSLATRNINASDVSTVNIYENHQPITALKGLSRSDESALDIKLKNNTMLRPTGNIKIGAGAESHRFNWLSELFSLLVSKKMQGLVTVKGNNSGKDYRGELSNRYSRTEATSEASNISGSAPFGAPPIAPERYLNNKTLLTSLNFLLRLTDDNTLRFNLDWQRDDNRFSGERSTVYDVPSAADNPGQFYENITINQKFRTSRISNKTNGEVNYIRNSSRIYLDEHFSASANFSRNRHHLWLENQVDQHNYADVYRFTNRFNLTLRRKKHAFSIVSDTWLVNVPNNMLTAFGTNTDEPSLTSTLYQMQDTLMVNQKISGLHFNNHETTSFIRVLSKYFKAGMELDFDADYQSFVSRPYVDADATPIKQNDVNGLSLALSVHPWISYSKDDKLHITLKIPIRQEYIHIRNNIDRDTKRNTPFIADFSFNMRFFPESRNTFIATFSRRTSLTGFSSYITSPIYTDYRSTATIGSGNDSQRKSLNSTIGYMYKRAVKGVNFRAELQYFRSEIDRLRYISVSQDNTSSSLSHNRNITETIGLSGTFTKVFLGKRTSIGSNFNLMRTSSTLGLQNHIFKNILYYLIASPYLRMSLLKDNLESNTRLQLSYQRQNPKGYPGVSFFNYGISQQIVCLPTERLILSLTATYSATQLSVGNYRHDLFIDGGVRLIAGRDTEIALNLSNITDRREYYTTFVTDGMTVRGKYPLKPFSALVTLRLSY